MGDEATRREIEDRIKESILRELQNGPQLRKPEFPEQLLHRLDSLEAALREQHNALRAFLYARSSYASISENSSGKKPPLPPPPPGAVPSLEAAVTWDASPPPPCPTPPLSEPEVLISSRKSTANASTQTPLARAPEKPPSHSPRPAASRGARPPRPSNLSRPTRADTTPNPTAAPSVLGAAFEDTRSPTLLETLAAQKKAAQDQATLRQRKVAFAATTADSQSKRPQGTLNMDAARREMQRAAARKAAEARQEREERSGIWGWLKAIALVVAGVMMLVMGLIVGLMAVSTRHHNSLASM